MRRTGGVGLGNGNGVVGREVLVVDVGVALHAIAVVADDDHRRVHARAHALHLAESERPVRRCLAHADAEVLGERLGHVLRAVEAARRRAADLQAAGAWRWGCSRHVVLRVCCVWMTRCLLGCNMGSEDLSEGAD